MKTEKITLQKIVADDGMILTDGEIYGKEIFLGAGRNAGDFHEITQEEYDDILAQSMTDEVSDNGVDENISDNTEE